MKNDKKFTAPVLSCTAGAVLLAASISAAIADTSVEEEIRSLEEIIVTARKREESLQDTPVVISALSKESIDDFAIESMEDIADFTPGMLNAQRENQAGGVLALRGIGSSANSPVIDQAVSLVVDDMQIGTLQIQRNAIIDMESVQVYKGPQALFFGKNSPGGVVSIRSADPGDEFEAQLKTGYEFEADEWFVQGMVSGPFSDAAAGRLVVRYGESDGYFDIEESPFGTSYSDKGPASEDVFVRGTLLLDPTEDLSIRTKLTYADRESQGGSYIQRFQCNGPGGTPQASLPFECEGNNTLQLSDIPQASIDALDAFGLDIDPQGNVDVEQLLFTVGMDYAISDELTLTSVTGYYENTFVSAYSSSFGLGPQVITAGLDLEFEQFTQELRLASDFEGPVNFVTGVFYEQKEHDSNNPVVGLLSANTAFVQETEAYSVFLDMTWDITDTLALSGGARYSYEEKDFDGSVGIVGQDSTDWDDISPQATLSWRATEEWMFYASYREGFKSGGYDGSFQFFIPIAPRTYEEEEVDGFEVGAKGTLLDNTLQLNMAFYAYDYTNLQLSNFNSATLSAVIFNAGEAESTGLELDFVWLAPVDGLQVRGAIAYNDTEVNDVIADCWTGQTIAMGCDQISPITNGPAQDISGNPLVLAPELTGNLGLSYERDLNNVVLGLSMDLLYSDEYEPSYLYIPGTTQDSYTNVNAAIRLSSADDTWSAALIGRNLTDEYPVYTASSATFTGAGTGTTSGTPGDWIGTFNPGQTIAVEFQYNFR